MSRDHMLGFVQGAPDPLARALDDDAFGRQVGRMVRGLSAAEQAVQSFETVIHQNPDGTVTLKDGSAMEGHMRGYDVLPVRVPQAVEPQAVEPLTVAQLAAEWDEFNAKLRADRKAQDMTREADNARRAEAFKAAQAARLAPDLANQIADALRQSPGYMGWANPPCNCYECQKAREWQAQQTKVPAGGMSARALPPMPAEGVAYLNRAQVAAVGAGVPVAQLMRENEAVRALQEPANPGGYDLSAVYICNSAPLEGRPLQVRAG